MEFYQFILEHLNYYWIWFLMLLESTVIPVPSEFVVPPAAYFAASGHLNVWLVILAATIGADCGATINYFAGRYLGRPIIYRFANSRWGHLCLLNQEKVEKSERYFNRHGIVATLTGRFVPVISSLFLPVWHAWAIGNSCSTRPSVPVYGTPCWPFWDGICRP